MSAAAAGDAESESSSGSPSPLVLVGAVVDSSPTNPADKARQERRDARMQDELFEELQREMSAGEPEKEYSRSSASAKSRVREEARKRTKVLRAFWEQEPYVCPVPTSKEDYEANVRQIAQAMCETEEYIRASRA
jgi:hypothetical protein